MDLTVIYEFPADDLLFFFIINVFNHLLQFQCVAYQATERRRQLIQRRFRQPVFIHPRQYRFAPLQHLELQIEGQALALSIPLLAIPAAQFVLVAQPALQRARRNLQKLSHARHIAIVLINLVQRVDLSLEGITSTHLSSVLHH